MSFCCNYFLSDLYKCVGKTVTIFTNTGGNSGASFTGVLIFANSCLSKILIYPRFNKFAYSKGIIAVIPTNSIVAFTHCTV